MAEVGPGARFVSKRNKLWQRVLIGALCLLLAVLATGVTASLPARAAGVLKLPWAAGGWNVTQGQHSTRAWDFQPPGAGSHNDEVLAVAAGTARITCTDSQGQAIVSLDTDSGTFRYVHLQTSAVQAAGVTTGGVGVAQGQVLGRLHPSPPGSDSGCGYAVPAGASHLHLQMPVVPITIDGVTFSASGPNGIVRLTSTNTRVGAGTVSEGQFVSHGGHVYRVAGGAALYVSSWDVFGGGKPTTALSDAQFSGLRPYPADGTFVNGMSTGRVFRFAGGAPQYVSTWDTFGGAQPTIGVDDFTLDRPDGGSPLNHVRRYPVDGSFVTNAADGRVYRIAGGAPLYVSSWSNIGGQQPSTVLDPWEFQNYQHLRAVPVDGFIRGLPSGRVFRVVASGHPYYVGSWDPFGGQQPFLDVDDWAIDNCDHLNCSPFGFLDAATGAAGALTVTGWAFDPNAYGTAATIHLYVGGPAGDANAQGFDLGPANQVRTDVAKAYPGTGNNHGFNKAVVTTKRGSQKVYLYALNVGGTHGDNALIGSATVTINATAALTATPTPTIRGTVKVGRALTASVGSWQPSPVTLGYQWLKNGSPVSGATKASYTLTPADLGATMSVRVIGSKSGYTPTAKTSASTVKVSVGALTAATPKIGGTPKVGRTLTAKPGIWKPAGASLTYKWYRGSKAISGATRSTYILIKADKGKKIRVKVTGTLAGYAAASKTSKSTSKIK